MPKQYDYNTLTAFPDLKKHDTIVNVPMYLENHLDSVQDLYRMGVPHCGRSFVDKGINPVDSWAMWDWDCYYFMSTAHPNAKKVRRGVWKCTLSYLSNYEFRIMPEEELEVWS